MTESPSQHVLIGPHPVPVVLASASRARAAMLEQAGVICAARPANVDEVEVKRSLQAADAAVADVAVALAALKAETVSRRTPGVLVIGADQMLECGGVWFDKPAGREGARATLRALRGRDHRLISAVVAAEDGRRVWHHVDQVTLSMRAFDDAFLETYLDAVGEAAFGSVGAYQLEGLGAQLIRRVDGDFFTVLGMPLLPLLAFLRDRGVLAA
ncbi:MAG: Maf family protein [Alphaproteobacteria bacterium]